jgi:predicted nucleotidyltransferase
MAELSSPQLAGKVQSTRVSTRAIDDLVQAIVDKFSPDKVILFGSHAYGEPRPWSDVDLLVVMDTPQGEGSAMRAVRNSLPRRPFSVDVVVRSQAEIDRRIALDDWFLEEITRKGHVLYERTDR